ncbi:MAG: hypothetical protein BGN89_06385 [Alphaproteobacteria bacterium 64-6]|nr:MAG: hypothetical protein BGN89_06385 [Alphaproteobacteria bacterium 64-6]
MSNQTHDPQAPGHGAGAPEPDSTTPGNAQRAAAEYTSRPAKPDKPLRRRPRLRKFRHSRRKSAT